MNEELQRALESVNIRIVKLDRTKTRQVSTTAGTLTVENFAKKLLDKLGPGAFNFPKVAKTLYDTEATSQMLREFAAEQGILKEPVARPTTVPDSMKDLTLNMDLTAKSGQRGTEFFMTDLDEIVSPISGSAYIKYFRLDDDMVLSMARPVIPVYEPRKKRGVFNMNFQGQKHQVFNVYIPPKWNKLRDRENKKVKPPALFTKLVNHLFPIQEEREYFYDWAYASLYKRAFVYLILCGIPGSGKNRLKLVMRALHGHINSVDGKKSTLTERFNSQLSEATLAWFDELSYNAEMENVMKELQNDSIAIERKGIDATKGTRIHASLVISNNKARDNFIAMDARKFVPLVVNNQRLETSMTHAEINELTEKVENEDGPNFDKRFLAQIANWLWMRGDRRKYPNLEYKGPMFWRLALSSMTRWQKKAVYLVYDKNNRDERYGWDEKKKAFLWSAMEEKVGRKNGDRSLQFPDFTSVSAFFDIFRDGSGRKAFSTEPVKGDFFGDFWVKPILSNIAIAADMILETQEKANGKRKEIEKDDL